MSIYYFLLYDYDPFVGPPNDQHYLSRGFTPVEERIRYAEKQRRVYRRALDWSEIKANLRENRLCSKESLRRFEVHYRCLSAFVHPLPAGYDLVYGRNRPSGAPRYDHYAAELALLYINKLAASELKLSSLSLRATAPSMRAMKRPSSFDRSTWLVTDASADTPAVADLETLRLARLAMEAVQVPADHAVDPVVGDVVQHASATAM